MGLRLTFAFSVAALGLTALAPTAAASELAPGLWCENYSCRNDTDDVYRVEAEVTCWNGISTEIRYVGRRTTEPLAYMCAPQIDPGTWEQQPPELRDGKYEHVPPKWVPGQTFPQSPFKIEYRSAVVDNNPRPAPSGSGS
ncbi:hypothetical protein [Nocardia sp. XZ_19_385]|uniref:hypothetical protein n=1 Tax=Nocardia sp. XZ_19_385 TaxID=2769488 RepID=UPI00188E6F5E|nr:hypothetical protein [Nocardia sp. XZ_19_385]